MLNNDLVARLVGGRCRCGVLLLLVAAVLPVKAQQVLSLDSCRAMALRNNKQLNIAKLKQDVARDSQYNFLFSFIWNIANDVLVNAFNKGDYKKVILPMLVLRCIDVLLEPTGSGYGAVTEASGTGRLHCKRWGFVLEYRKGESHNGGRYSAG